MIDKISYKIMNELRYDGRASNAKLARKLGISVITVAKKINSMIEKGVIVIKAMPNPVKMGYHFQAFIGLSVEPKKMTSVCNQLTENIHVHMVTTCLGRFDVLLIVFFKDLETLQDFIKIQLPRIDGINSIEPYYMAEYKSRSKGIFMDVLRESKPAVVDKLDQKIIKELIQDGRPNYADLADKLGVSRPTVSRRVSLLIKKSIISILAIPDPSKIGFTANAYVVVNAEYDKINKVCDHISSYAEVHLIMRLMNGFDILFGVYSTNLNSLYHLLQNRIGNIDGISKIETFMCGDFFYFSANAAFASSL